MAANKTRGQTSILKDSRDISDHSFQCESKKRHQKMVIIFWPAHPKPLNSFSSNNTYQAWLSVTVLGVFHLVVVPGTRFQSSWVELKMRHQQTACHRLTTPSQDSNLPFLELGKHCASMMRCRRYHHLHVIHCLFCVAYKWHHRIVLGRVTVMIPPTLMWCSTAMEKDRVQ